ncbi:hypothetical protein [Fluviispira multicolorata]|uniref:Uncharacterized protein n=1 Tax=Fluviispira multicolorata TaxID=2654512 RepID=A0A833JFA6_9BACT|nr:hypothetical protein [Fluviispira multicolorata]KAB8030849.1 hypothetical protein GCL57_07700 [Fluviispira multicolorata]
MKKLSFLPQNKIENIWSQEEYLNIVKILNKKHAAYLENEEFEIEAGFSNEQVQVKVSLRKNDNSVLYPIECLYVKEFGDKINYSNIAINMIDYLDLYWADYFIEERDIFVPLDWSKHEFEGTHFYLRGFVRNIQLEEQAESFLAQHGFGDYDIQFISSET